MKLNVVEYTEIIDYTMPKLEKQNLAHPVLEAIKNGHVKTAVFYAKNYEVYKERHKRFADFKKQHLIVSQEKYTQGRLNSAKLDYDCVICESDVIWSPGFCGGHFDRSFFLALDSMKNMNRIAYAPSMSDGELTKEQEYELRELISFPEHISCRESYEKAILEKYTDKTVTHVLDPVMLLKEEDYYPICAERLVQEKYLFLYVPADDNLYLRKCAYEYADENNLKILEISTKLQNWADEQMICYGSAGIEEFLSAIKYAEIVFTNSFHAICFSIIFNVQFYAFSRNYAGKVKDICDIFSLRSRYFSNDEFQKMKNIDFEAVHAILNDKRKESSKWLSNAIQSRGVKIIFFSSVLYMTVIWEIRQSTNAV